jgi:hypothetical protein
VLTRIFDQLQQCLLALGLLEHDPVEREHNIADAQPLTVVVHIMRVRDPVEAYSAVTGSMEGDAKAAF